MTAEASSFDAPLSLRNWTRALRRGLGRTVLDVERHGVRSGMIDALIDACVTNYSPATFHEDLRVEWLLDLAERMSAQDLVLDATENALRTEGEFSPCSDLDEPSQQSRRQRRDGDEDIVLRCLKTVAAKDSVSVHTLRELLDDVSTFVRASSPAKSARLLQAVYELTPCPTTRFKVAQSLLRSQAFPSAWIEELHLDCSPRTRDLARRRDDKN